MIHFVYAGDPFGHAIRSPDTITQNLFRFLGHRSTVVFHNWQSRAPVFPALGDIVIGHPHPDANTALRLLWNHTNVSRRYLLFPFHHGLPESNLWANALVESSDRYFAITGPYWMDTISTSAFAHWERKITRLDMAVDPEAFPHVKTKWNPKHERTFLAITDPRPEKGQRVLAQVALEHKIRLVHVGHMHAELARMLQNKLPHFESVGWTDLTHDVARQLCEKCDIFIHMGVSDANPTTILEAALWGLPVVCTPTSGYLKGNLVFENVFAPGTTGAYKNAQVFEELQTMPEQHLRTWAENARKTVVRQHTWDRFCQTIWEEIR